MQGYRDLCVRNLYCWCTRGTIVKLHREEQVAKVANIKIIKYAGVPLHQDRRTPRPSEGHTTNGNADKEHWKQEGGGMWLRWCCETSLVCQDMPRRRDESGVDLHMQITSNVQITSRLNMLRDGRPHEGRTNFLKGETKCTHRGQVNIQQTETLTK